MSKPLTYRKIAGILLVSERTARRRMCELRKLYGLARYEKITDAQLRNWLNNEKDGSIKNS